MKRMISIYSGAALIAFASFINFAQAQQLDVPVIEHADENLDTCSYAQISGLKADGDGFLAVRSGPGSNYTKLDELKNNDKIWLYDQQGDWIGIVYGTDNIECSSMDEDREIQTDGKKGWVHQNWVEFLAG